MNTKTKFHRHGTVTIWDVYTQSWRRTRDVSDRVLASLSADEKERVQLHILKGRHAGCRGQISDHGGGRKSIQFFFGSSLVADYNI